MAGDLPITRIYRSASAPPVLPSVAAPVIVTLKQALEREVTVWARIRAQVSQRHQEYQDEKKREQDRVEKELLILRKEREAQEKAQAELEATFPLATAVSASVPITVSWGRQIEEWAQIRAQATERYQKYRLEREMKREVEREMEGEMETEREMEREMEKEQGLAEDDEHLPVLRQQQDAKKKVKLGMIRKWLRNSHLWCAPSASERAQ